MENDRFSDLREDFAYIHTSLSEVSQDRKSLDEKALELATEYAVPLPLMINIGLGFIQASDLAGENISETAKRFIREYVSLSENEIVRQARISELAVLFNRKKESIRSFVAHKKIRENRSSVAPREGGKQKRAADLSREIKDAIRAYVAEGETPEEKTSRRAEMAEKHGVPVEGVNALTAYTRIWADRTKQVIAEKDQPLDPEDSYSSVGVQETRTPPPKNGSEIDYSQSIEKKEWRKRKLAFLLERTTPQERKQMKGLVLTGRQWLDAIEIYIPAGIPPQNIVGVENSPEDWVQEEFEATGKSLGCETHPRTELLDFLRNSPVAWSLLDFDFLGQMCPKYVEIMQQVRLSSKALVFTNFMGKREGANIQDEFGVQNYLRSMDENGWQKGSFLDFHQRTMVDGARDWESHNAPLKEMRDEYQGQLVRAFLGTKRHENSLHQPQLQRLSALREGISAEAMSSDLVLVLKALDNLLKDIGYKEEERNDASRRFYYLSFWSLTSKPFLVKHKGCKYVSAYGRTPFVSDFLEVHSGQSFYKKTREAAAFLLTCLERFYVVAKRKKTGTVECQFRIRKQGRRQNRKELIRSDQIVFDTEGEKSVQISVGKLFSASDLIAEKLRIEDIHEGKDGTQREMITV